MNIHSIVEDISKDNNNIALVFEKKSLTYKELNEKSNQLARKLNCKDEELVGILLYPSLETIISILAILKSGGTYVPILPSFPNDRINYMINDTKLKKMIVASDYNNSDLEVIDLRTFNYNEFDGSNLNLDIKGTNLAYIIYTSGSTGQPKGVMIEHKNVINTCDDHQPIYTIENKDICKSILFSSFTWDVSVCEIFTNLFNGNTLYILSDNMKKNVNELYNYINNNNIEICYFPPALLCIIPYEEKCCIKKIIFAGEKCDNKIGLIWAKRVKLYNYYGPAEATIYATGKQVDSQNVNEIGKPIKNMNAYIVDPNMNLVKDGEKGELLLSGLGIARGYLNLPEQTKESFIKNPFASGIIYKTGDIVCMNKNGDLEYIGRVDNQVNIRGKRVELNEVNEVILSCDFIDNSVVKCKTNEENINEYIFCNYTIKKKLISDQNNLEVTYNNKLKDFLKEKLPDYMIPQYFILLDKFELNASGKIDQNKLKEPLISNIQDYKGELLTNEKYILVNTIINKINNTEHLHEPDNNLNNLGIDSLKTIQLISELNKNNYTIEVDVVLKCKTINDVITSLTIIKKDGNDAEDLYNFYIKKNANLDPSITNYNLKNNNNKDSSDPWDGIADIDKVHEYFSSNFYLNNENTGNLHSINDISKLQIMDKLRIGINGSCQSRRISNVFSTIYNNDWFELLSTSLGVSQGQSNILNLVQDITDKQLNSLKVISNNLINDFSFPTLDKFDIIILTSDTIVFPDYIKYKYIDTDIEFIIREKELIDYNVDLSKFEKHDKLTYKELELCINKLILKYPTKKFIFINNRYSESIQNSKLRKEYNEVYNSFKNTKNIYILDLNKCTHYDEKEYSTRRPYLIPGIDLIKISNTLYEIINGIIKLHGQNFKISKFFLSNILYNYDNYKIHYLNEDNNYLTNVISMNDKFNDRINSIGLSWKLNNKFLLMNNAKVSIYHIPNEYLNIPILNCKLIFHARTDKYYKNLRFKIYTGFKWEIIEKEITTEYQQFELESEFNYSKPSRPRIGFSDIEPNMIIFINNPYFDL